MDSEKISEKAKVIGKFLGTEGKKTYKEFATIKVIMGGMIFVGLSVFPLLYFGTIPYLKYVYPVFILIGFVQFWGFLKWAFPRYMIMQYILGNSKIGRKITKNTRRNGLPPFRGI